MSPADRGRETPHLRAVPSKPEDAPLGPGAPAPDPSRPDRARPSRTALILAVALLAAVVGLVVESRRATRLGAQVAVLEGELATARTALEAHRHRLAEARHHVSDLRGRVEILDALLASEPGAPPSPGARPAPPPPAAPPALR